MIIQVRVFMKVWDIKPNTRPYCMTSNTLKKFKTFLSNANRPTARDNRDNHAVGFVNARDSLTKNIHNRWSLKERGYDRCGASHHTNMMIMNSFFQNIASTVAVIDGRDATTMSSFCTELCVLGDEIYE